ncbi:MAG: hypothetical protein DRJ35_07395 [Thermoprotei archaeon]|nr:MAG: hypothetical protein DRJ35_07395 [Thermoprotei archaeon]
MKSAIFLKVEVPLGTWLEDAIRDAKKIAEKIGVGVEFDFNDIPMVIFSSSNIEEEVKGYWRELKRRAKEEKKNE